MKNLSLKNYIISGLGVGFPTTLLCMTIIGGFNGVILEFGTWMIASALFGLVSGIVFTRENLSLPLATAIHCVCCLIISTLAGTIIGYADNILDIFLGVLPVFLIAYVIIYLFIFFSMKREANRINNLLNNK